VGVCVDSADQPVTLPRQVRDGKPVTHALLLTNAKGGALYRPRANEAWRAALVQAGITAAPKAGERPRTRT
jgi:hypothetical protein